MPGRPLRRTLTRALAAVVVLAALGASPAGATIDRIYPGDQCHVSGFSWSTSTSNYAGIISNTSPTNWLYVDCPLPHDLNTTSINFGVVAVTNMNPGAGLSCTLYSVNYGSYNSYTGWSNYQVTYTSSPTQQYLSFGSLPGNDHYYYYCWIPPMHNGAASSVNAYRINEN